MKKYKVIFLDIDGVLNSVEFNIWKKDNKVKCGSINPKECQRLDKFCTEYDIKLVISSTWRNGNSYIECITDFKNEIKDEPGLELIIPHIVGVTPYSKSRHRGQEIQYFFDIAAGKYPEYKKVMKEDFAISEYCIVDDDSDMLDTQMSNFVQTNTWKGITENDYIKIKQILKI